MENFKSESVPQQESQKVTAEMLVDKLRELSAARERAGMCEATITGEDVQNDDDYHEDFKEEYEGTSIYDDAVKESGIEAEGNGEAPEEALKQKTKEIADFRDALQQQRRIEDEWLNLLEAMNRQDHSL
jgi:hypothetical protein